MSGKGEEKEEKMPWLFGSQCLIGKIKPRGFNDKFAIAELVFVLAIVQRSKGITFTSEWGGTMKIVIRKVMKLHAGKSQTWLPNRRVH